MNPHACPQRALAAAGISDWRNSAIIRNSFSSVALKETSFKRSRISRAERGVP